MEIHHNPLRQKTAEKHTRNNNPPPTVPRGVDLSFPMGRPGVWNSDDFRTSSKTRNGHETA